MEIILRRKLSRVKVTYTLTEKKKRKISLRTVRDKEKRNVFNESNSNYTLFKSYFFVYIPASRNIPRERSNDSLHI